MSWEDRILTMTLGCSQTRRKGHCSLSGESRQSEPLLSLRGPAGTPAEREGEDTLRCWLDDSREPTVEQTPFRSPRIC